MHKGRPVFSIVPQESVTSRSARCVMLYDWEKRPGSAWLDFVEVIFRSYGLEPFECTATIGEKKSKGGYRKLRSRISSVLNAAENSEATQPNVIVNGPTTHEDDAFFPSEMRVVLNCAHPNLITAMVAVSHAVLNPSDDLIGVVPSLIDLLGPSYGCIWDFPCSMGPDFYLSSVIARPDGVSSSNLRAYGERLTRWRDRRWLGFKGPCGYFREIYSTNLVLPTHLNVVYELGTLGNYMRTRGTVEEIKSKSMYVWKISEEMLEQVRVEMEGSGLVLSAATQPRKVGGPSQ